MLFKKGHKPWNKGKKCPQIAEKMRGENNPMYGLENEKSPSWKGGRINRRGYIGIRLSNHPRTDCIGYVPEHYLVAEEVVKKINPNSEWLDKNGYLKKDCTIHHINENKKDNRWFNLYVFNTNKEHTHYHLQRRWNNVEKILISNLRRYKYGEQRTTSKNLLCTKGQRRHRLADFGRKS